MLVYLALFSNNGNNIISTFKNCYILSYSLNITLNSNKSFSHES